METWCTCYSAFMTSHSFIQTTNPRLGRPPSAAFVPRNNSRCIHLQSLGGSRCFPGSYYYCKRQFEFMLEVSIPDNRHRPPTTLLLLPARTRQAPSHNSTPRRWPSYNAPTSPSPRTTRSQGRNPSSSRSSSCPQAASASATSSSTPAGRAARRPHSFRR